MYKSPVELIYGEIQTRTDGEILQAVRSVGVSVDKDELMRALAYDRDQYQKGFWGGCGIRAAVDQRGGEAAGKQKNASLCIHPVAVLQRANMMKAQKSGVNLDGASVMFGRSPIGCRCRSRRRRNEHGV